MTTTGPHFRRTEPGAPQWKPVTRIGWLVTVGWVVAMVVVVSGLIVADSAGLIGSATAAWGVAVWSIASPIWLVWFTLRHAEADD